jgi:hypothetical protein
MAEEEIAGDHLAIGTIYEMMRRQQHNGLRNEDPDRL